MTYETLCEAILEAERFLKRAKEAKGYWDTYKITHCIYDISGPANAAARRASMDLTRALAKMRKY